MTRWGRVKSAKFESVVADSKTSYVVYKTSPPESGRVITQILLGHKTVQSIVETMRLISDFSRHEAQCLHLGANEVDLVLKGNTAKFDAEYVTELEPLKMPIDQAINIFTEYLVEVRKANRIEQN